MKEKHDMAFTYFLVLASLFLLLTDASIIWIVTMYAFQEDGFQQLWMVSLDNVSMQFKQLHDNINAHIS